MSRPKKPLPRIQNIAVSFLLLLVVNIMLQPSAYAISSATEGLGDQYEAVGAIGNGLSLYASGTMISNQWVLSAGHVVEAYMDGSGNFFSLNGMDYTIEASFLAPGYMFPDNDIGLFRLTESVAGVTMPTLYDGSLGDIGSSQHNQQATLVGYGQTDIVPSIPTTADGTRRAGVNTIVYDNIDIPTAQPVFGIDSLFGSAAAPGDSGGPVMFDFGSGEVLVGVHSFYLVPGAVPSSWSSWAFEVSPYMGWISTYVSDVSWGTEPTAPVPEPATMFLFGSGLAGLAMTRRGNKKKE